MTVKLNKLADAKHYKLMSNNSTEVQKLDIDSTVSPDEVIDDIRALAEAHPSRVITRNFYRNHSILRESHWNCYFGTFTELKRQANITLSRGQHALERKIGMHASRDVYRRIGKEREDLDKVYIRKSKGKYKTIFAMSDLHDEECDPFMLRVAIDTVRRIKPDVVCLAGDLFDLAEFGRYNVDPREWDIVGKINFVHDRILKPLRESAPDAQIDLIEGNHERRLLLHLAENTPALRAILSDLHGMTVAQLLGLDKFEVNYVAKGDLAAINRHDMKKELEKSYKIYWDTIMAHHFPYARSRGMPGFNGHHHKHIVWPMNSVVYGSYEWHQLGGGHVRDASYCEGEIWSNGFLIANMNIESKSTCFDYVPVTDFAVSAGKFYYRTEQEGGENKAIWPGV